MDSQASFEIFTGTEDKVVENNSDQFSLLEAKFDMLIKKINKLKDERDSLAERCLEQEEQLLEMTEQIEALTSTREQAAQKIVGLLSKIEQIDV